MKKYSIVPVFILILSLLLSVISPCDAVLAKAKFKLNKSKLTLYVGDKATLKLSGAKTSGISWKSSNKKVAAVSKRGTVTAKSRGTCKVTATYKKKGYSCNINVKIPKLTGDTELDRAINLGIVTSAPDKMSITGKQFYTILNHTVTRIDSSKLKIFKTYYPNARTSSKKMTRFDGMMGILAMAEALGGNYLSFTTEWWDYNDKMGDSVWDEIDSVYSYNYYGSDRDLSVTIDDDTWSTEAAAYFFSFGRYSIFTGNLVFDYDSNQNTMHVADSLTYRDAIRAALRFHDSDEKALSTIEADKDGESQMNQVLADADKKRNDILHTETTIIHSDSLNLGSTYTGTAYYVSNSGNDSNSGTSPEKPWASVEKVSSVQLESGDAVFFERGGSWSGQLTLRGGVTYSAYGSGEKPLFTGTSRLSTDESDWSRMAGSSNIWVYKEKLPDVGVILLGKEEKLTVRVSPWYVNGRWVDPDDHTKAFDVTAGLKENLQYYSATSAFTSEATTGDEVRTDDGELYLRCDAGNPVKVYGSLRFLLWGNTMLTTIEGSHIGGGHVLDNLAVKYCGGHGVFNGWDTLVVQNCEFGWIGGCVHYYLNGQEPVRFGNAIESDGIYDGYYVKNNYLHDCYDTGASNQMGGVHKNVNYVGNLIERCNYGIEIFNFEKFVWSDADMGLARYDGITIKENVILYSQYGFSEQRPNREWTGALIFNISDGAVGSVSNVVIENNTFALGRLYMFCLGGFVPDKMTGNTIIQFAQNPIAWLDGKIDYTGYLHKSYGMNDQIILVAFDND